LENVARLLATCFLLLVLAWSSSLQWGGDKGHSAFFLLDHKAGVLVVLMSRSNKNMLDYQQSFNKKKQGQQEEAEQTSG
jgi:hypothetical protein